MTVFQFTFKVTKVEKVKSLPLMQTMFLISSKIFQELEEEAKSGTGCVVIPNPRRIENPSFTCLETKIQIFTVKFYTFKSYGHFKAFHLFSKTIW